MATSKYVAYYRVSTQRQGKSGLGLEAQRQAVGDFLNGNGWEVVAEYTEIESGGRKARPELEAALRHARKDKATLVIAKLDRLTRDTRFMLEIADSGVPTVFCDLPELPAGPTGRFMLTMLAAVAELEAGLISQRTRAALQAAKARGVKLGVTGKERARENRAAADAFARNLKPVLEELAAENITSVRKVADALNERGIETSRRGRWHPTSVSRLLARLA